MVTEDFLEFSKRKGNDLITPNPIFISWIKRRRQMVFVCTTEKEAYEAGCAPKVELESTDEKALRFIKMEDLISCSVRNKYD